MCKWLPPNGFTGQVHHLEAKVGGTYKMSFTNFSTGSSHSFGGEYLELTPNERIRHTIDSMIQICREKCDDDHLKQVMVGTEVNIVQEGRARCNPAEACYLRLAGITEVVIATRRS
jgi:hypothetical protein